MRSATSSHGAGGSLSSKGESRALPIGRADAGMPERARQNPDGFAWEGKKSGSEAPTGVSDPQIERYFCFTAGRRYRSRCGWRWRYPQPCRRHRQWNTVRYFGRNYAIAPVLNNIHACVYCWFAILEMKKRVYTLYRVSTKGQVEKDDIPMQKEACRNFAEGQDWEIVKEFSEKGVSGFKKSAKKEA